MTYQGEPLDLPPAWVADVQTGSGHGRTLTFLRLKGAGDHVEVEEVTWRGRSLGGDTATGRVRRVIVEEERLATFLELLRHLPTVRLKEVTQPIHAQGHRVGGGWMSSGDFFSLVRVVGPQGETLLERSFAGYPSSRDQLEYLPLEVVCAAGQRAISQAHRWVELLGSDLRRSHFVSAFVANREAMLEDSYWWVMEESVEALGYFGHPGAIPTVVSLRTRPQLQPRQLRKIERLLDEPDRWLTGAPKQLVE